MSEEYSFEELRAKHRGWMDHDWAAIRRKEQEQTQKSAEAAANTKAQKSKTAPMVFKDPPEQIAKPQTVPLKGSIFKDLPEQPVKAQAMPLKGSVFKDPPEHTEKPKTIPLKGSIDDDAANDENAPPSLVEVEKVKAAKKARREERANRTRKIKVMDVKEIRGETQTSK